MADKKERIINGYNLVGFLSLVLTFLSIALYDGANFYFIPKWVVIIVAFLGPSFFYTLYIMYERRDVLIDSYDHSKIMFGAIKQQKKGGAKK